MAESKRDYYEVLGITKTDDQAAIKKAYREKAKMYHPDLHPGDAEAEQKFKEVNEAYSVLSDSDKKAKYDAYGHAAFDPSSGMGGGYDMGDMGFDMGGFGDIFETIFGGMGGSSQRRGGAMRGEDLALNVSLTFEEAVFGCKKTINYSRVEACPDCEGSGAEKGTSPETCTVCHGSGQVKTVQRTILGMIQTNSPCSACRGSGKIIRNPCSNCRGTGYVKIKKTLEVKIPAGIDEGQKLPLRGMGNAGRGGGASGDLYLYIAVMPHNIFTRDGLDIYCDIPITFASAALGGEITVPTLTGDVTYTLPEGTQTGSQFVLRDKGVKSLNGRAVGSLIFTVTVSVPKNLTKEQRELLIKFAESCDEKLTPRKKKKIFGGKN